MTIRRLAEHGYINVAENNAGPKDVSIVFAFDSGYLEHFKVTLASLAISGNFIDSPIVIYTDDHSVARDNIVKICGDKIILLEGAKKNLLYKLARDHVKRPERADWNRGTFLKWMTFEKQDTTSVVFLDIDMIFLKKFDLDIIHESKREFNATPQFRPFLYQDENKRPLPENDVFTNISNAVDGKYFGYMTKNINSGVMVLKGRFLSDDFFNEITNFAQKGVYVNEQTVFSKYFIREPQFLNLLHGAYNFQDSYLYKLTLQERYSIMERVIVLHYAGPVKPWKSIPTINSQNTWIGRSLWHWHRTMADKLLRA